MKCVQKGRCTPHSWSLVLLSPTTPGQYDLLKNADIPSADQPPSSSLILQSPTTPGQYDLLKNADIPSADQPPSSSLILQSPTTPGQYDLLKNADVPSADLPPTNQASWYRALLYQVSWIFMYQVGLTFEDADIHSAECN